MQSRRPRRWVLALATACGIAGLALAVACPFTIMVVTRVSRADGVRAVMCSGGIVQIRHADGVATRLPVTPTYDATIQPVWPPRIRWQLGSVTTGSSRNVFVPVWPASVLGIAWGTLVWRREIRHRRRLRDSRCVACGYPRAGVDPTGACPECGAKD